MTKLEKTSALIAEMSTEEITLRRNRLCALPYLNEEELLQLRKLLATFFAQRAVDAANRAWDEKGWTDEDVDRLLNSKLRKRSNSQK